MGLSMSAAVALGAMSLGAFSASASAEPVDCPRVTAAFDSWRVSSWQTQRLLDVSIDDELKAKLTDQVTSQRGQISVRSVKREVFDKDIDLDEEPGDPAVRFDLSCERAQALSAGRYLLTSGDGLERMTVRLDAGDGQFFVEEWTRRQTIRVLWKKVNFALRATYAAPQAPAPN